jgi:ankyrin repeat protein
MCNHNNKVLDVYRRKSLFDENIVGLIKDYIQNNTPLIMALREERFGDFCDLLHAGADPNEIDVDGNTPMHCIARRVFYDKVMPMHLCIDLLDKGAMCDIKNKTNETVYDIADDYLFTVLPPPRLPIDDDVDPVGIYDVSEAMGFCAIM